MIYSYRHPKRCTNDRVFNFDFEEALKHLPKLVEQLRIPLKSITTTKPDRAPPRLLTGTCDGIHPTFSKDYIRKTMALNKIDVPKLVDVIQKSIDAVGLKATNT